MCLFRQFADPASGAYTYLLADMDAREAAIVDLAPPNAAIVASCLHELDLSLEWVAQTHTHPSESAAAIAPCTGISGFGRARCPGLKHGDQLVFGDEVLRVIGTPGHTAQGVSLLWRARVFTGDTLLIGGCGRTDLEGGDAGALYDSITRALFALPDETLVYPAHDYAGRTVSSVAEERARNVRVAGRSRDEFITLMRALRVPPHPTDVQAA